MARITSNDISEIVDTINNRLKERGVDLVYIYSPRNGYIGIDIRTPNGSRDGIYGDTNKEIYGKLEAMNNLLCEM